MTRPIYLDLDGALDAPSPFERLDLRHLGPKLRYHGTRRDVDAFFRDVVLPLPRFVLYGSGDFHYLTGVFLRRISEPFTLISFDNHPDWDIRPPHWSCGGWINRALELDNAQRAVVWGCGNFELQLPSRLFANRLALRNGRLQIHPWTERQPQSVQRRFDCMTRQNWPERFEKFCDSLSGKDAYVTIDLDCLVAQEAVTNWENGLFTAGDIAWALRRLLSSANIIGGDICGAWSQPRYDRFFQRLAASWDHPAIPQPDPLQARSTNAQAVAAIWDALTEKAQG